MKRMFLKVFALILLSGCSLTKKEAFNLKYNERRVIDTFEKVPLYSINSDGSFNFDDYTVFEFDGDLLTAQFERRAKTRSTSTEKYAVEIIEDLSPLEGLYRLHGSGSYGGKYLGITAITNGGGSYAKLALGDNKEGLLKQSREMPHWQYASQPLVGRAFNSFTNNEVIVRLHESDLKYHVQTTTNAVFKADASGTVPDKIYFTNVQPDPANPNTPTKTALGSVTVTGVQLFPPSIEVYSLQGGEFFGIEYHTNTQLEKLQMRFARESTLDGVLSRLQKRSADYDWESEKTADIPHRVLSLVAANPIVTLTPYSANPIGSSTTPIIIQAAYDWENTTQYGFDLASMTAEVITVHDKITNASSYKVRMISDLSETKGVIQFTGRGVLNQQYGLLEITNKANLAGYLVLAMSESDLTAAGAVKTPVQDKVIAQQPHRVVIEMQRRGKSWVGVQDSGVYSMTNTTNWTFDSEKLLVQAKIMTNTTPKTSTYKIKMLNNFSDDQGSFKLLTTTEIIPGLTADTDGKAFENYVLAVKLGSGVDNVRAMLEINESQAKAEELLEKRVVWNLYEQSAVPSGNRIIKTLASIHPWIKLSSSGYYTETETEVWWFDPDAMSAVVMEISNNGGNVTTNGASYEVEMAIDLGAVEGGFKLKNPTPIDQDYPNVTTPNNALTLNTTFQDKFMYVLTGTAVNASKAYIGIGDTIDDAKANKPSVKNNYHTLDNAPLSAIAIEAAVDNAKNKGHKYVALQAPAAASAGSYLPYDTEEFVFSVDPLQVEITVITADNARKKETHPIQIVRAINSTEAIFKYLGTGSLAGKFAGFRVQEASGSTLGTHLIITNADSLADAESELQKLKIANQWTHDLKEERLVSDANFNNNLGPWGAVDLAAASSGTTYDHLLYDYHNTTNFTFNTTANTIKVDLINRDITNSSTYEYEVMSQEAITSPQKNTTIVRLTGDGAWNTRYLGIERFSQTLDSKSFKRSKIVMSGTYGDTVTALTTAATNYYEVSALNFPKNAIQRADGDAASGAIGDTLVMVDDKGIWNADNTQELRFRFSDMTVNISDVDSTGTRSHRYNIIVERTTTAPANNTDEAEAILYLKSFENDDTARLHKKFVKMKVESGATPKKVRFVTADNKSAAETAFTALNGQPNQWNFQDRTSTAIDVRVIATAGDKTWTKLAHNLYYWDSGQVEQWTFDAAAKTVRVVSTNGSVIKTENYRIGMKESISATEGIFLLAGSTASDTMYNGHMAYLGFGTGVNDRDANGLLLTTSTGDEAARIAHLKSEAQKMNTAHNWNLREKSLAELSNRAVANAAKVAEWRSLEDKSTAGSLKYDDTNYTSLKISADTANNKLTNIVIQKVGTGAKGPITFQHKMHQDVSDYRGIFQLYNGNDAEYTNKYMAIELGTAVNDRLLKVGIGDTPLDAQNKLNEQTIWNYMDKNMAVANDRIVQEAVSRGSAVWISYNGTSGPHQPVQAGQTTGITFDAGNATNLVFDSSIQTLKMQYITTTPGTGGAAATTVTNEFVYGYTMVEDTSRTEGVFRLDGFGDYNRLFVSGVLGSGTAVTDPDYRRARIGFGEDVSLAKQARNSAQLSGKYNILARPSLLIGDRVLETLRNLVPTKGSVVRTTGPENNAFDTRNTKKFKFLEDPVIGPMVQIVEVISNVHITNQYNVFMTYDKSATEGVFRVENLGSPDNNKIFGLKINNDNIHLWEATDAATAKNQLDGVGGQTVPTAQYRYETNIAITGRDSILQKFNDLVQISMLDSDQIYLAHDTELWTHNVDNGDMSITKIPRAGAIVTTLYKAIAITNITSLAAGEATKGAFLLESEQASAPYNNKYVAMTVMNDNSVKLATNDTLAAAISDLNGLTHENFVRSSDVQIDDSALEKAGAEFRGEWATLLRNAGNATYLFDYKNTEEWKFSAKEREIIITNIANNVQQIGTYRLQLRGITGNDNAADRISGQLIHKSGAFDAHNNKFVSIKLPAGEFNTLFWGIGSTFAEAKTLRDSDDPLMIPLQYGTNSRAAIEKLNGIGNQACWYPVDSRGNVQQNAYVYDPNPGSGNNNGSIPGPNYTININLGKYTNVNGSHNEIPNTLLGNFFVRIIEATDDNNIVFLTYKGLSPYGASTQVLNNLKSEFSNKYSAIQIGTGPDVFRAKIAKGNTLNEAKANLNALTHWNYVTKFGLYAGDYITNLEVQNGVDQNNVWVGNADGGQRVGTYNANNTTNWNIDAHNQAAVIDIINGNVTNSSTYGITRLYRESDRKGIFLIEGYGPFNRKLVMVERGGSTTAHSNKLRLLMHDNVTNLTNMFATRTTTPNPDGTDSEDAWWNFRRRDDILPTLGVVATAADAGPIVSLFDFNTTTPRRVYDPEEATEYSFDKVNRKATISVTTGGVTSSYTFDIIMSEHISNNEGVFQLVNGPPLAAAFNNWFYAMKISGNNIVITSNASAATAKSQMQAISIGDNDNTHFRTKSSRPIPNSRIMNDLATGGAIVALDQYRSYRDHTTTEFVFDAATKIVQIVVKADGRITSSDVYKVVVVEDYDNTATGANQFKGLLLLKGSTSSAAYNNNFFAVQRHHTDISSTNYNNDLTTNAFRFTHGANLNTAKTSLNTMVYGYHRKAPLVFNDSAFETLATLYDGKWASLGTDGQNIYLYDRRNTEEMLFDYKNKLFEITNITPVSGSTTSANTNIGKYAIWVTNISGVTDNANDRITFKFKFISGTHTNFSDKWGSIKFPAAQDSIYRGFGQNTASESIQRRDDGRDPTVIPLLHATNSSGAISNLNRLGKLDCWHPVDQNGKSVKGQMVYDPNPGQNNNVNPGPGYAVNFNLGLWSNAPNTPTEVGTQAFDTIPGAELNRFFVRIIESSDDYNAVFRTYQGLRKGSDNTYINVLTNTSGPWNVSNIYHAITVGTGPNLYKAKIARGNTAREAQANLNALTYYNYRNKQAFGNHGTLGTITNAIRIITNIGFSTSKWWYGTVNGEQLAVNMIDATVSGRLISVRAQGVGHQVNNTYQMEHLYAGTDHEHNNGSGSTSASGNRIVFKLIGFGPYANKIVRVLSASNNSNGKKTMKFVMGDGTLDNSGVIDIDRQWAQLTGNTGNMVEN